jgi:hypothetical protein
MRRTEGGARQNCVVAERRGDAAIANDCTFESEPCHLIADAPATKAHPR